MQSHQQATRVSIDAALRLQSLAPIRNVALSEHKLKSGQYQRRLFALMAEVAASLSYSIPIIPIMRTGRPTLKYVIYFIKKIVSEQLAQGCYLS